MASFVPYVALSITSRQCSRQVARFVCSTSPSAAGSGPVVLESTSNSRVKFVRSLFRRKQRDETGKVVLEGHRLVLDTAEAGYEFEDLFYSVDASSRSASLTPAFERCKSVPTAVTSKVMTSISDTVTPQGVVAVMSRPDIALPNKCSLLLLCDGISDPGNLGTLIRAAAGAGVDGILLTSGCTDPWGPKALRSGMSAQLKIPMRTNVEWDTVDDLREKYGMQMCVADSEGSEEYDEIDLKAPTVLVIGSEANGVSDIAKSKATKLINVPLANEMESLNAAVAGAVILFEAHRQRRDVKVRRPFGAALYDHL